MVVAPLERLAAEILGGRGGALDVRPHRAVEDEHAVGEGVEVRVRGIGDVAYRRLETSSDQCDRCTKKKCPQAQALGPAL